MIASATVVETRSFSRCRSVKRPAGVVVQLAAHVEDHQVAGLELAVAAVVVRGQDAPGPERVWTGLDDRVEGQALGAAALELGLQLGLERALVDACPDMTRRLADAGGGDRTRLADHGDLFGAFDHAQPGHVLRRVFQLQDSAFREVRIELRDAPHVEPRAARQLRIVRQGTPGKVVGPARALEARVAGGGEQDRHAGVGVEHERGVRQLEPGEVQEVGELAKRTATRASCQRGKHEHAAAARGQPSEHADAALGVHLGRELELGPVEEALLGRIRAYRLRT